MLRLASESANFPYTDPTVCFLEVDEHGRVTSPPADGVCERIRAKESRLYAVWPGRYRSDLFLIDDVDVYEKALGVQPDPERTGLQEHEHVVEWKVSPYEQKPDAAYIQIDVTLDCGCRIRDLRTFADHMKRQRGWDVAVTGGLSGGGSEATGTRPYTLRARRRSLV